MMIIMLVVVLVNVTSECALIFLFFISDWHVVHDVRLSETSEANVMMIIVLVVVLVVTSDSAYLI